MGQAYVDPCIELKSAEHVDKVPQELELVIFRFAQEALTNLHRHPGNKTGLILIDRDGDKSASKFKTTARTSPERLAGNARTFPSLSNNELSIKSDGSGTRISATLSKTSAVMQDQLPAASEFKWRDLLSEI